jgi:glycerol-3-phosphate dehydrogenase
MSPADQRAAILRFVTETPLDVLVIGGGIVGAGVARDAAMRGLRTGLVEQHDFAFGTSGRSSRLLHGGLRYLAQGRLRLVHEASVEKMILHRIAPHLSAPLPFLFPVWRGSRDWKLWKLKIGVKIYDLLCGGRNLGKSTWHSAREVLAKVPGLDPAGLKGAVRYYDGFTNDARLTIDTLRSATRHGAAILNYCRYIGARRGEFWECQVTDELTGHACTIRARSVVNATGPWSDGLPHSQVKLRLTKGIHLVIDNARLPVPDTVVMTDGPRILFAIPWGERTILGTTDTDYDGAPEDAGVTAEDTAYLLAAANGHFPDARLTPNDVISAWSGVRPLIADPRGRPSDISRAHQINQPEADWWDVAGGKLTTYRLMAEQTVDLVLRAQSGAAHPPCRTCAEPLLPMQETESISTLVPPPFSRELVEHFVTREWAVHVDDILVRRAGWRQYCQDWEAKARQIATWMGELFGWSAERRAQEIERCRKLPGWTDVTGAATLGP